MAIEETLEPVIASMPPEGNGPRHWRGVNLFVDKRRIGDDELALSQNFCPVAPEMPSKRGCLSYGGSMWFSGGGWGNIKNVVPGPFGATVPQAFVLAIQASNQANGLPYVGIAPADGTGEAQGEGVGQHWPALAFTGVAQQGKTCFAVANGAVYAVPGWPFNIHAGIKVSTKGAGPAGSALAYFNFTDSAGNIQAFSASGGASGAPRVVAPYSNRLVYGNFGPGFEQALLFSDSTTNGALSAGVDPLSCVGANPFAANGRAFLCGISSRIPGDRLVGLKEVLLSSVGAQPQKGLLALMENTTFLLTGEPNQSTDNTSSIPPLNTLQIQQFAFTCGCSSQETICSTPYGTLWAGPDDVWFFAWGQTPVRVGTKIRPVLQRTPAQYRYRWHAAYFNGFYRLALDSAGAAIGDDSPCGEQWWLDLRGGAPQGDPGEDNTHENAEWWGPMQFIRGTNTNVGNVSTVETGSRNLFLNPFGQTPSLASIDIGITADGPDNVLLQYDTPGARDVAWDSSITPAEASGGTEVLADIRSKELDFGDARADKLVQGLETNLWVDSDAMLSVDFNVDQGKFVDTEQAYVPDTPWVLGVDTLDTTALTRQSQGIAFWPGATQRLVGKTCQARLYDSAGYPVLQGVNDTFIWVDNIPGIGPGGTAISFIWSCVLAPGMYANATALITALCAAMGAAETYFGASYGATKPGGIWNLAYSGVGNGFFPAYQDSDLSGSVQRINGQNVNYVAGTFTAQQFRSSRKMMALLGFDSTVNGTRSLLTTDLVAVQSVYAKLAPVWEMSDLAVNAVPLPRRPQ